VTHSEHGNGDLETCCRPTKFIWTFKKWL